MPTLYVPKGRICQAKPGSWQHSQRRQLSKLIEQRITDCVSLSWSHPFRLRRLRHLCAHAVVPVKSLYELL